MPTLYNRIQGRNVERLAALSDGIFAVAMTLLVLDLHIPTAAQVHSERELFTALAALGPQWIAYLMSFLTLGIFWAGQQTQLNHIGEGSRDLTWIHLGFLFTITLMPLSTRLLAEFITYRAALGIYWLNIFAAGAMLYWSWAHATRANLIKPDTPDLRFATASAVESASRSRSTPPARPSASSTPMSASPSSCSCS